MVKTRCLHLVIMLILLGVSQSKGQNKIKTKEEQEIEAYSALNAQEYIKAYGLFDKLHAKYPAESDYQEKLGLCCLYYPEKKGRAIEIFTEMREKNKKSVLYEYYLGKAYHINYKFDEALAILEPLVTRLGKSKTPENKAIVEDATLGIMNCYNGKILIQNKVFADIKNIGQPVNTEEFEYVPVITTDESVMYFTYRGKGSMGGKQNITSDKKTIELRPDSEGVYTEDIYYSMKNADGSYSAPKPVESINTNGFESAIAISPDGQSLFTFSSSEADSGDIFMSKLNGDTWEKPTRLNSNINTQNAWEGSCSITADGRYLYFASERPGGLGGRDIWVSERVGCDWGPAVNLGPKINTKYDDDAPFIHPDGITLFFSSKGHTSIGGYDIMFSVKKDNDWTEPKSMGIPLNTTEDDNYYVINYKGDKGFFSSNRAGSGGFGNYDIYSVTPGILGEKPVVALLKGTIYGDDKPIEGKIEMSKKSDQQSIVCPSYSNKSSGNYMMALSPGTIYHIKVSADGFEPVEDDIDIGKLDKYMEQTKDFNLYSPAVLADKKAKEAAAEPAKTETAVTNTITEPVKTEVPAATTEPAKTETPKAEIEKTAATKEPKTKKEKPSKKNKENGSEETTEDSDPEKSTSKTSATPCTDMLPDFGPFKGKSLNNPADYQKLLDVAGNYCAQKMYFKIQVGAYRNPGNFNYDNIKKLGKIASESYPDGITRFTQKEFKTLQDAETHRQKVIGKGIKDAWIVVFVDGKRYTLEDFIMVDFLGKTVN